MRGTRSWAARCFVVIALAISLPASAHLVFTYTSNELPLTSHIYNGEPDNVDYGTLPVRFSYSFTVPEQDLSLQASTTFRFKEFSFSVLAPESLFPYPLDLTSSRSGGWVTLDSNGNITGWNVMLRMTELITPQTDLFLHWINNNFAAVKSSSEGGDKLTSRFHLNTWHRDHYVQLGKAEMSYSGGPGSWSIQRIAVPESGVAGLLLAGSLGLLWARRVTRRNPAGNCVV